MAQRIIIMIVLLLLIAGAINVLVAWRCATLSHHAYRHGIPYSPGWSPLEPRRTGSPNPPGTADLWDRFASQPLRGRICEVMIVAGKGWQEIDLRAYSIVRVEPFKFGGYFLHRGNDEPEFVDDFTIDVDDYRCTVTRAGWPVLALKGKRESTKQGTATPNGAPPVVRSAHAIRPAPNLGLIELHREDLPLQPIIGGFVINTLFYAALLAVVGLLLWPLLRRRRLDQNRCPRCKYDLRGAPGENEVRCPECGTKIARKKLRRPKQILRWWMTLLFVPHVLLGLAWFTGLTHPPYSRAYIMQADPLAHRTWTVGIVLVVFGVFLLCLWSYRDRKRWQQVPLAIAITAIPVVTGLPCLLILCARFL